MEVDLPIGIVSPVSVLRDEESVSPFDAVDVSLLLGGPLRAEVDAHCEASVRGNQESAGGRLDNCPAGSIAITPRMRATLCGWMVEVCQEFSLHQETLFLSIHLTDRFLARQSGVKKHQLQLVGTACLFIAAKQEEVTFPGLTAFVDIANNSFSRNELALMEVRVLHVLEFKIAAPTVCVFLSYLIHGLGMKRKAAALATYLLELSVVECCTIQHPPSTAAVAAVVVAGCVADSAAIRSVLKGLCGSVPDSLQKCLVTLVQLYDKAYYEEDPLHYFHVLREKYCEPERESVAIESLPTEMETFVISRWMSMVHSGLET